MKFYQWFIFIALLLPVGIAAARAVQGDDDKKLAKDAETCFKHENYSAALSLYLNLEKRDPTSVEYKFRIGICYIYESRDKHRAIDYLEEVKSLDPKAKDIEYYLGLAYHKTYNFKEALEHFNAALASGKISDDIRKETERHIQYCHNGEALVKSPLDVDIQNLGKPINTTGSEYTPVISMDQSMMIYTYKGEKSVGGLRDEYGNPDLKGTYSEDIYLSYKVGDSWLQPEKNKMFYATVFNTTVPEGINSAGHDASIALSVDGQKLFVYKDTEVGSGDIYLSERDGEAWTYPVKLNININSDYWEGSASISADERTIYFSSERPGGFGGKDLYRSVIREDGIWGEAENLGEKINTTEDDDAPFIHPDNRTLYFSSKGHKSIGGYDIFFSKLDAQGRWSSPQNIGYPINTTADDIYFVITGDGTTGYFSSSRVGGYGEQDIYSVSLRNMVTSDPIVLLKGKVTANDAYTDAAITCSYKDGSHRLGPFRSNRATGEYSISLPVGQTYVIGYESHGFGTKTETLSTTGVAGFKVVRRDVYFYSPDYTPQLTVDGRLLYSENPTRPAGEVTVKVTDESGTFTRTAETDQKGVFRFISLPPDRHYIFTIEQKDPDLIPGTDPILMGTIMRSGAGLEGVAVNTGTTDQQGGFRIGEGSTPANKYETLPENIPALENLYLSNPDLYSEIMKRYGKMKTDELIYKVQVAALKNPKNFNYAMFADLGEVETVKLPDELTRFTIGSFQTLAEAEALRDKIIQRDVVDAFTLIFYNGERKYLKDVVAGNLWGK